VIGLITRLGEETLAIFLLCAVYWCISKKTAYVVGVAYFLSGLTVMGMKIIFRVDRPWVIDPSFKPVPSAIEHATGYSFPSGHTQAGAAMWGSLGVQLKQKPLQILCFCVVILIAFSRMYLGVHTLPDVVVSLLITFFCIFLAVKFVGGDEICKKRELAIAIGLSLYAVAVLIVAAVLFNTGVIEQAYLIDTLKAAGASIGFTVGMYFDRVYINFSVKTKNLLWQFIKFILGIAGVLLIKEGLKLVVGTGLVVDTVRYFLMLLWITALFPLIIKRFFDS
jgi:undecaprenyl-diphosphatase